MTKTKILTYNYKSATLKRADVRKAIKEVNAEYAACEDTNGKLAASKTAKSPAVSRSPKKG